VWRQKNSLTVHLVNLTNPMMMKGPMQELIPVGEQSMRLRLPGGLQAKGVQLLAGKQSLPVPQDGTHLTATVPPILDHEVVAIDL
jgi:hypothetical protein